MNDPETVQYDLEGDTGTEVQCFGRLSNNSKGQHHNLDRLDAQIWRGCIVEPNTQVGGYSSWNEVSDEYVKRLNGRDPRDKHVKEEMDRYMVTTWSKGFSRTLLCIGCHRNELRDRTALNIKSVSMWHKALKGLSVLTCELFLGSQRINVLVAYASMGKGGVGLYRFWRPDGGYATHCALGMESMIDRALQPGGTASLPAAGRGSRRADRDSEAGPLDALLAHTDDPATEPENPALDRGGLDAVHVPGKRKSTTWQHLPERSKSRRLQTRNDAQVVPDSSHTSPPAPPSPSVDHASRTPSQPQPESCGKTGQTSTAEAVAGLEFRAEAGVDYKQHVLGVYRNLEQVRDCSATKDWKTKAGDLHQTLEQISSLDIESMPNPLYFRAGRNFKGQRYQNMQAALIHMSGEQVPDDDICSRCKVGAGPFTTCVVRGDAHKLKGSCSNCVYNNQGPTCSFRVAKDEHAADFRRRTASILGLSSLQQHDGRSVTGGGSLEPDGLRPDASTPDLRRRTASILGLSGLQQDDGRNVTGGGSLEPDGILQDASTPPVGSNGDHNRASVSQTDDHYSCSTDFRLGRPESRHGTAVADGHGTEQGASSGRHSMQPPPRPSHSSQGNGDAVLDPQRVSRPPTPSIVSDASASDYTPPFLDYVVLDLKIAGNNETFEMGLGGCGTLDAFLRKLLKYDLIDDVLSVMSVKFSFEKDGFPGFTSFMEPGDVIPYKRLMSFARGQAEVSGDEGVVLKALVKLGAA